MIKLNLSSLVHAEVGHQETLTVDLGEITVGDIELAYLQGELRFTRVAKGVLVEGALHAQVKTECTRCLTPYYEPIVIELEDEIGLPGAALTPERPVRINENGWADLAPLVREYAWLALPVNAICSEACQGICPECGGNLNQGECDCEIVEPIDPRWAALQALVEDNPESE